MKTRLKRAQSILEYLIALTAIVAGFIAASGYLKSRVGGGVNMASNSIYNSLSGKPSLGGNSTSNSTNPTGVTVYIPNNICLTGSQLEAFDNAGIIVGGSGIWNGPGIMVVGTPTGAQQTVIDDIESKMQPC